MVGAIGGSSIYSGMSTEVSEGETLYLKMRGSSPADGAGYSGTPGKAGGANTNVSNGVDYISEVEAGAGTTIRNGLKNAANTEGAQAAISKGPDHIGSLVNEIIGVTNLWG